jgi:hypothetical protein
MIVSRFLAYLVIMIRNPYHDYNLEQNDSFALDLASKTLHNMSKDKAHKAIGHYGSLQPTVAYLGNSPML